LIFKEKGCGFCDKGNNQTGEGMIYRADNWIATVLPHIGE
jgi:hypothetical protein